MVVGGWGCTTFMLGMAALATAPAFGGVDDGVNALMAVGVGRGGSDDDGGGAATNWAGRQETAGRPLPQRLPSP